jgi:hypothetical protein
VERVSTDTLSRLVEGATAGDVAEMIELVTQQVSVRKSDRRKRCLTWCERQE